MRHKEDEWDSYDIDKKVENIRTDRKEPDK